MSKFISYGDSIVNLDRVSLMLCDGKSINFYSLENADLLEAWHFKDEETAFDVWELIKEKSGVINLEPL